MFFTFPVCLLRTTRAIRISAGLLRISYRMALRYWLAAALWGRITGLGHFCQGAMTYPRTRVPAFLFWKATGVSRTGPLRGAPGGFPLGLTGMSLAGWTYLVCTPKE